MTITPDQITHKKLILVRQMFSRASILSSREHSTVDKIMALVAFDLTVETLLKIVVSSLDATRTPSDSFQGLITQANTLLQTNSMKPVPDQGHIQHIHSLRNDAQHKTKYPNKSDLDDSRVYVRDFLKTFVNDVYGIDFESISQTELVNHSEIKKNLIDAENYFKNGDYKQAAEWANIGLQTAVNYAGKPFVGSSTDFLFDNIVTTSSFRGQEGNRDITKAFKRMQNTLRHVALGLDYSDKVRFNKIAGYVMFQLGGGHDVSNMKENISEDEAEFVLSFAINAIIQIENRVGDLEKPFGEEYWL